MSGAGAAGDAAQASVAYPSVPGPVDRERFFDAQRRHRRAATLFTVLAVLALVLMSLPLAAIVFPLLFGLAQLASLPFSAVFGTPDVLGLLHGTGGRFMDTPAGLRTTALVVFAPGVLLMLGLWRVVHRRLASCGPRALAARLGARAVRSADYEERRLANVVAEMALAAGVATPQVMVLDESGCNVAVLGDAPEHAVLVVTRGLLERAGRAETQALIGSAIAMTANGDLRGTFRWIAALATFNVVTWTLLAACAQEAREPWRRIVAALRAPSRTGSAPPDAAPALDELLVAPPITEPRWPRGAVATVLAWPFFATHAAYGLVGFIGSLLLVSPSLALLMRRRRYLADAVAVQLTRDPGALAAALAGLHEAAACAQSRREYASSLALAFVLSPGDPGDSPPIGLFFPVHPSLERRHGRALRLGAGVARATAGGAAEAPEPRLSRRVLVLLLLAVAAVLAAAVVPLMLLLVAMLTGFMVAVGTLWVALLLLPLHWLFG